MPIDVDIKQLKDGDSIEAMLMRHMNIFSMNIFTKFAIKPDEVVPLV